ncbi:MAG TPA: DUF1223 domain-containing protein [Candidatus Angelobacter sp.]
MKIRWSWPLGISLLAAVVLLGTVAFRPPVEPVRSAVVVELFTSEGCSSCPPADELLIRLGRQPTKNVQVIPLGFHVDYWDHQGWRDRFSSHAYTERQEAYASRFRLDGPYTPQMVVDGETEFVGNDSGRAQNAILEASAREQTAEVQLSWKTPAILLVRVTSRPGGAPADVHLAITEDNLSNKVAAGENDGRELHHSAVVREFRRLGQLNQTPFNMEIPIMLRPEWKKPDLHFVVFVQSADGHSIRGAASAGLPK